MDEVLVEKILAAKRAEQPSRGATACQAVAGWERDTRKRHGAGIADPPAPRLRRARRVYRLYPPALNGQRRRASGLTAAEIKVVESASAKAAA